MVDSEGIQSSTFLFLEAFANLITKHSSHQNYWVARTGSYSIYELLSKIVPEVRSDASVLDESQLTKHDSPAEFKSVCIQLACKVREICCAVSIFNQLIERF